MYVLSRQMSNTTPSKKPPLSPPSPRKQDGQWIHLTNAPKPVINVMNYCDHKNAVSPRTTARTTTTRRSRIYMLPLQYETKQSAIHEDEWVLSLRPQVFQIVEEFYPSEEERDASSVTTTLEEKSWSSGDDEELLGLQFIDDEEEKKEETEENIIQNRRKG